MRPRMYGMLTYAGTVRTPQMFLKTVTARGDNILVPVIGITGA